MTFSSLAQVFSLKPRSTQNATESEEKKHRSVRCAFDGHVALKGFGTLLQSVEIPIDPQDILDGHIPFNFLVLKPQSAAFDETLEGFAFIDQDTSKLVLVVFTSTNLGTLLQISILDDGPGMWVIVADTSSDLRERDAKRALNRARKVGEFYDRDSYRKAVQYFSDG